MASGMYTQLPTEALKKTIDLVNDTVKVILLTNTHAFNNDNLGLASVVANEISGTGYTPGGETLTTKTVTQDDANNRALFDADNVTWTTATFTAAHAVIYDDTPTSPADPLICSIDFGGDESVTANNFEIRWDAAGIIAITT